MMSRVAALHLLGVMVVVGVSCRQVPAAQPATDAPPATAREDEIAALKADVEVLKGKAPSASVAMADVGFHWSNLWFAGQSGNPMPKGPDGMPVDVKGIFDGIDTSTLAAVKAAIDKKDGKEFETAYRGALESCYQCHKAVGRPYLRPMIPKALPQTIINLDARANWPQ